MQRLFLLYKEGELPLQDLIRAVDELANKSFRDGNDAVLETANSFIAAARAIEPLQQAYDEATAAVERNAEALRDGGDAAREAAKKNEATLRQAESSNKRVNALLKEREELQRRYNEQVSRGADETRIAQTLSEIQQINEEIGDATRDAIRRFQEVDLGNPEITRAVTAQVDATVARLENIAATFEDQSTRAIAEVFRTQFRNFVSLRQEFATAIQEELERGGDLLDIDFTPLVNAERSAREAAQRTLAELRRLNRPSAETQAQIVQLERFVRSTANDLAWLQGQAAQQTLQALGSQVDAVTAGLADLASSGASPQA